jgi:hypothetical protein
MNNKTAVILIGNARGGEETWATMYNNLLTPFGADLILCFGKTSELNDCSLYKNAKYLLEMPEYNNWSDYYRNNFIDNIWEKSFLCGKNHGLAGGLESYSGSGAIIFAFRHFLKNYCRSVINKYERIILTRSDHFYIAPHPVLDNDNIWIVEGEDYGGITDRHHIFPSNLLDEMLGVVEYMNTENGYKTIEKLNNPNPEMILYNSFKEYNILDKIKRFKRCQFTVATYSDSTRWMKACMKLPNYKNLLIKYPNEYITAINNKKTQ